MSVECKSVILVGIPYSKATWDNLTDEVKKWFDWWGNS